MPTNKQSIAGSLLQTLTRLCTAVGYGIATAIFDAVQKNPSRSGYYANNVFEPYAAVFWFAVGICFIGVLLVPFLRITTQGHEGDKGRAHQDGIIDDALGLDDGHAVAVTAEKGSHIALNQDLKSS